MAAKGNAPMTNVAATTDAGRRSGGDLRPGENAPDPSDRSATIASSAELAPSAAVSIERAIGPDLPPTELLRAISEASPFPLVICRQLDGEILYCNSKLGDLLGVSPNELVGRRTLEFYQDAADRDAAMTELATKGRVREREVQLKTKSGQSVWAIFTIEPLECPARPKGSSPEGALLLGALYDVTRRRETEDCLQQSEARFRGFVENSSDLVFALDRHATLTYLSPNVTRILGYNPSQLLGSSFDALVHGSDLPKLWQITETTRDTAQVQASSEFRMRHRDGSTRWFTATFVPVVGDAKHVVGLTGTAHDITPEKAAMEELERANQSLRDAQLQLVRTEKMASLGLLMAGIAHEIPHAARRRQQHTADHLPRPRQARRAAERGIPGGADRLQARAFVEGADGFGARGR